MIFGQAFSYWVAASRARTTRTQYVVSMSVCGWRAARSCVNLICLSGTNLQHMSYLGIR